MTETAIEKNGTARMNRGGIIFKNRSEIDLDEMIEDIMEVKSVKNAYSDGYYNDDEQMYHEALGGNALHFIKKEDAYGTYLISMEEVSKKPFSRYEVIVYDPSVQICDCKNLTYFPMRIMTKTFRDGNSTENRSGAAELVTKLRKNGHIHGYVNQLKVTR